MKTLSQIHKKIISFSDIQKIKNSQKKSSIVFTNGCFDILHLGHLNYLSKAKDLGDVLWVGLNSDSSVKKLKGKSRPINSEEDRALLLASLFFINYVTIFSEDTPIRLITELKPNIHVKGGDYIAKNLPEYETIQSYGGTITILPFVKGKSTTNIIEKIRT
ncbi:MAG: D-glycero-beta-D-manno-heptose 1-phosphate adenylyltransferase [Leptospiraceae bacterium]|nr:D-glycero-beta-D-manno-heptose 1-phosphate adenylyltransferase [Leptospiraceae bacterium]MCK6379802.1 D-glycero-beta-D-manno-heptose 1-phosphate adenylyltransferase [Leptospiraceae bacterium]NUM41533.1 D-glycero-beta-D-manno-heptose 1-phosphate adenylyltransferase [Leptospiraceae bacterium]